jgi:hypothetical protein
MSVYIELGNRTILLVTSGQTEKVEVPGFEGREVAAEDVGYEARILAFDRRWTLDRSSILTGLLILSANETSGTLVVSKQPDDPDERVLELDCSFEAQ